MLSCIREVDPILLINALVFPLQSYSERVMKQGVNLCLHSREEKNDFEQRCALLTANIRNSTSSEKWSSCFWQLRIFFVYDGESKSRMKNKSQLPWIIDITLPSVLQFCFKGFSYLHTAVDMVRGRFDRDSVREATSKIFSLFSTASPARAFVFSSSQAREMIEYLGSPWESEQAISRL